MSVLSQFFGGGSGDKLVPVEVFAVGGGGGGTTAGGGAGQVIYTNTYAIVGKSYNIAIGAGGTTSSGGSDTSISGLIVDAGGGGRGGVTYSYGGSAGGVGNYVGSFSMGGPIVSATGFSCQNPGGTLQAPPSPTGLLISGGGGGALAAGNPGNPPGNGAGGAGIFADRIGISTLSVGGGGGGGSPGSGPAPGGIGGGGGGPSGINATANTGGGGAGTGPGIGGNGGSGLVIIRYPTSFAAATVSGNTPIPAQSGYYVYRWNSGPGSITFN